MPISDMSNFILRDLDRANKLTPEAIGIIIADRFQKIVLTGDLVKDIEIVKEATEESDRPKGLLPIQLKNGRVESPFVIRNLLQVKMQQIAKGMMGRNGRLDNKTGRLLRSSFVEPQIVNNNNTVSLQFSYMFGPYEVFDPRADVTGGGPIKQQLQSTPRSPRILFQTALREAAEEVLLRGYSIKISQVGVTQR